MVLTVLRAQFTSPLAGEVGARSAPGGGYFASCSRLVLPPSLTLPRKGGEDTTECGERQS